MNDVQLKPIPHSIEAEQGVIGGILFNPSSLDDVLGIARPEDFFRKEHITVYRHMLEMTSAGRPMDILTLSDELRERKSLAVDGEVLVYLGDLARNTAGCSNIVAYANIVRGRATQRRLLNATMKAQAIIVEGGDTREMLDKVQSLVCGVEYEKDGEGPTTLADILPDCLQDLDERSHGGLPGISTGFLDLDKKTAGLHPGDLCILAGRPSMGKTALAMNMATDVAETGAVLVFSLEMSREQLTNRLISNAADIPFQQIRTGELLDEDWEAITKATARLHDTPIVIDETAGLTALEMRSRARKVHRKHALSLVVVDYLQLATGTGDNRTQMVGDISHNLKAMAKELKVPVLALSQLNRSLENRPDKRPVMSDLRDSGDIEQDADLIMFLYRDEVYKSPSAYPGYAELIISKQRNGPIGKVWLAFDAEHVRFRSTIPPTPERQPQPFAKHRGFAA